MRKLDTKQKAFCNFLPALKGLCTSAAIQCFHLDFQARMSGQTYSAPHPRQQHVGMSEGCASHLAFNKHLICTVDVMHQAVLGSKSLESFVDTCCAIREGVRPGEQPLRAGGSSLSTGQLQQLTFETADMQSACMKTVTSALLRPC